MYLNKYLIEVLLLHHSTFIWHWYLSNNLWLYGTTNRLSKETWFFTTQTSFSSTILWKSIFWNSCSTMKFFRKKPWAFTILHARKRFIYYSTRTMNHMFLHWCSFGFSIGHGISADITLSMSFAVGYLSFWCKNSSRWAWRRPHFWNSIVYMSALYNDSISMTTQRNIYYVMK